MVLLKVILMFQSVNVKQAIVLLRQFQSSFLCHPRKSDRSNNVWDIRTREYTSPAGIPGSGAGKGGGAGGSVRESGGGLGKYGAAQEEGYFHHKQQEQLQKIKKQLQEANPEISHKKEK